ncbi:MAG: QueT transporter family protein [Thaumarchaeota archaeon]|nr:QueT transporter family protein [Nitrososphaerota archaeon]
MSSSRKRSQIVAEVAVFAGLYFALTIALAPISFLPFQVRVSDILIMASAIVGISATYGVFLGCILANLFPVGYPPNPIDIVGGSIANLLASYAVYRIAYGRQGKLRLTIASLTSASIITLIVGSYLPFIILPNVSWGDVVWLGYAGVFPGELISQTILGLPLITAVKKVLEARKLQIKEY